MARKLLNGIFVTGDSRHVQATTDWLALQLGIDGSNIFSDKNGRPIDWLTKKRPSESEEPVTVLVPHYPFTDSHIGMFDILGRATVVYFDSFKCPRQRERISRFLLGRFSSAPVIIPPVDEKCFRGAMRTILNRMVSLPKPPIGREVIEVALRRTRMDNDVRQLVAG